MSISVSMLASRPCDAFRILDPAGRPETKNVESCVFNDTTKIGCWNCNLIITTLRKQHNDSTTLRINSQLTNKGRGPAPYCKSPYIIYGYSELGVQPESSTMLPMPSKLLTADLSFALAFSWCSSECSSPIYVKSYTCVMASLSCYMVVVLFCSTLTHVGSFIDVINSTMS